MFCSRKPSQLCCNLTQYWFGLDHRQFIRPIWIVLRIFANLIILLFVLWTASVSLAAFLDITIYFPWVVASIEEIPLHRLQSVRVALFLTFAHYGVLHLLGRNREYLPINFLIQYLFYLCTSAGAIFYIKSVPIQEYIVLAVFVLLYLLCILASRPLNHHYFKNK